MRLVANDQRPGFIPAWRRDTRSVSKHDAALTAEVAEHLSLDRGGGKRHIPLWLTLPKLGVVELEQLERFFDIEQLCASELYQDASPATEPVALRRRNSREPVCESLLVAAG